MVVVPRGRINPDPAGENRRRRDALACHAAGRTAAGVGTGVPNCANRLKFSPTRATFSAMETTHSDEPLWDVALEALLVETQRAAGRPLDLAQLEQLGNSYTIRLDDLLDTLCLLVENRAWRYCDAAGNPARLDRAVVRLLHANYRLNPEQLQRFSGNWQPN